jgi:hypothetical protein
MFTRAEIDPSASLPLFPANKFQLICVATGQKYAIKLINKFETNVFILRDLRHRQNMVLAQLVASTDGSE